MNKSKWQRVIVVGEGCKSEPLYIQQLNRYLLEKEVRLMFTYIPVCGGDFTSVHRVAAQQHKNNRNAQIIIWLDYDRYDRNDARDAKKLHDAMARGSREIPHFNRQNFEDFLSLHYPTDVVQRWQQCCQQQGHFAPGGAMNEERYMPLFLQHVCAEYSKGDFDYDPIITDENLCNLFQHNKDESISFSSDFATLLETEFNRAGCHLK